MDLVAPIRVLVDITAIPTILIPYNTICSW